MLKVQELRGELDIVIVAAPKVPSDLLLRRVDEIWQREKAARGDQLTNSAIFAVTRCDARRLEGHFVEYKWFLAQLRDAELFADLDIHCLAVSGLVETDAGFVFGLRNTATSQDQGRWELVPSGGIDRSSETEDGRVSYQRQLIIELQEELGLAASEIAPPEPFLLIEDSETHVIDIGQHVRSLVPGKALLQSFETRTNQEYDKLILVPQPALSTFLAEQGERVVAVSRALLRSHCEVVPHG
jgi:hypothetical protein